MKAYIRLIRTLFGARGFTSDTALFIYIVLFLCVPIAALEHFTDTFGINQVLAETMNQSLLNRVLVFSSVSGGIIALGYWFISAWSDVEKESAIKANKILEFKIVHGEGREHNKLVVMIKWETDKVSNAELRVWRSTGEFQLENSFEAMQKQGKAIQIAARKDGGEYSYVDELIQPGQAANYYAWIEIPVSKHGTFDGIVDFEAKRETLRHTERFKERATRRIEERDLKQQLKPVKKKSFMEILEKNIKDEIANKDKPTEVLRVTYALLDESNITDEEERDRIIAVALDTYYQYHS